MERVYKYHIRIDDRVVMVLPKGAQVLTVQIQGGEPFIWARVDPDGDVIERAFVWRGTGHDLDGTEGSYVGTVQLMGGSLVFHLFEEKA